MFTENVLRHSDLFQDSIEEAAKRFPRKFRQCSLEALMRGTEAVFCLVRGGVSDKVKSELLDYGAMQLRRDVFSSDDLRSVLKKFNITKTLTTPQGEIRFDAV